MAKQSRVRQTEDNFQEAVIEMARWLGWKVAHFRGVRILKKDGTYHYETPVQADGAGFPDLVMVHPFQGRTVYAELKSDAGRLSEPQKQWLEWLAADSHNEVYSWRPGDWPEIESVLR